MTERKNIREIRNIMAPDVGHRYFLSYFFLRHVTWILSLYVFVPLRLHPNVITALSILCGITAAVFALNGAFLSSAAMMIVWAALDCCDGEVARYTGKKSQVGAVMEGINSDLQYLLWLPAIAAGLFMQGDLTFSWLLAAFAGAGSFNVMRRIYGTYPDSIAGAADTPFKLFVASQFKESRNYREKSPVGKISFILWRNALTQFGLFESTFLLLAFIGNAVMIRYFICIYAAGFLLFSTTTLVFVMAAGIVLRR